MTALPLPHRKGPKVDIPEVPFHSILLQLFNAHVQADPERIAFIHHDNSELPNVTFKQLVQWSLSLARFLQQESLVQHSDIVGISLPSSWHYMAASIGIPANGAVMSGLSHRATPDESLHQLLDSEAVVLITTVENYRRLSGIFDKLPKLKSFLLLHTAKSSSDVRPLRSHHRLFDLDKVIRDTPPQFDFNSVKIAPKDDLYVLPYSSGTTGKPKGVMITHFNYVGMLIALRMHAENEYMSILNKYDDFSTPDHVVLMLPLYHAMGFFSLNANLARGNTVVVIQNYTDEKTFSAIQRYRVSSSWDLPGFRGDELGVLE